MVGFHCVAKNIEGWFFNKTSYLGYIQICLNFPKMITIFSTSSNGDSPFGSKQKFLKENPDAKNSDDYWLLYN